MPRDEWEQPDTPPAQVGDGNLPKQIGCHWNPVDTSQLNVCPGWIIRQAPVAQAFQACAAFNKGQLEVAYPRNEHIVVEAAIEASAATSEYEQHEIEESKRGNK